ncbi:MAG: hypothetical protein R3309_13685, partial [Reinekea sp.]|nr:hypothetical protein [Reinekea sp.]
MPTITLETRLPKDASPEVLSALTDYAALFSQAGVAYFRLKQQGEVVEKPVFMKTHGLTARQYNALKCSIDGLIQSGLSNLERIILEKQAKIVGLEHRITTKQRLAQQANRRGNTELGDRYGNQIRFHHQRIDHLRRDIRSLEQQRQSDLPKICFGSRRLFNAQHHLEANDYASHEAWKDDWQAARAKQFFVLGSADETSGCQGCQLLSEGDGQYTLKLRMPTELESRHGKYVYLTGICFPYLGERIEEARARQAFRQHKQTEYRQRRKTDPTFSIKETEYLKGLGQAISYRFVRDAKGFRILVTTEWDVDLPEANTQNGVVAVDFNAHHLAIVELDAKGHKVTLQDLPLASCPVTSKQNETQLQEAAKQLVCWAKDANKPVVIERLDFQRKKGALQKQQTGQTDYNRMLSSLSTQKFKQAVYMQCLKQQVALIQVNPAYTSLIGRLKYGRETDFNVHQAAAWVIGRRGMNKSDRLPKE